MDESVENLVTVTEILENAGYKVSFYNFPLPENEYQITGTSLSEMLDELGESYSETRFYLTLEEPIDEKTHEPYYDTWVKYVPDDSDGYFQVTTDRFHPVVSEEEADKYVAQIERTLIDAGLPVKIGRPFNDDNEIASEEIYY